MFFSFSFFAYLILVRSMFLRAFSCICSSGGDGTCNDTIYKCWLNVRLLVEKLEKVALGHGEK